MPSEPTEVPRRQWILVGLLGVVLVILNTWPTALRLDCVGRVDSYDGQYGLWQATWVARAIVSDPLHVYDANIFYPSPDDAGVFRAGAVGRDSRPACLPSTQNPYATHNLAVLSFFLLSFSERLCAGPIPHERRRAVDRARDQLRVLSVRVCTDGAASHDGHLRPASVAAGDAQARRGAVRSDRSWRGGCLCVSRPSRVATTRSSPCLLSATGLHLLRPSSPGAGET